MLSLSVRVGPGVDPAPCVDGRFAVARPASDIAFSLPLAATQILQQPAHPSRFTWNRLPEFMLLKLNALASLTLLLFFPHKRTGTTFCPLVQFRWPFARRKISCDC